MKTMLQTLCVTIALLAPMELGGILCKLAGVG